MKDRKLSGSIKKSFAVLGSSLTLLFLFIGTSVQAESALNIPKAQTSAAANTAQITNAGVAGSSIKNLSSSLEDHLAEVFNLQGDVRILKKESEEWLPAQKEMIIEQGYQILTGKESFVEIAYDQHFLNIARIEENTKAEFRSIEPTDLLLEDGAIFNALDGLGKRGHYQIATPTAVAGVQGTTFDVIFSAATKLLQVNCFFDESDSLGKVKVEIGGAVRELSEGQGLANKEVVAISPARAEHAGEVLQKLDERYGDQRSQGLELLASDEKTKEGEGKEREDKAPAQNPPGGGDGGNGPDSVSGGKDPSDTPHLGRDSGGEGHLLDQMLGEGPLGAGEEGSEDYGIGDHQNDLIGQNSQHNGDIQNYVVQQQQDQTPKPASGSSCG